MKRTAKEVYGAGVLFFYYIKWLVLLGLPAMYYGADYKQNIIMNILWLYCLGLIIKDFIVKYVLKKSYCDIKR